MWLTRHTSPLESADLYKIIQSFSQILINKWQGFYEYLVPTMSMGIIEV